MNAPRRHRSNGSARRSTLVALAACGLLLVLGVALAQSKGVIAFFGEQGEGNGQFNGPAGLAINEDTDQVYVIDQDNSRVQRFEADGDYVSQFGAPGSGSGQFSFGGFEGFPPAGIAVDNSGGASDGSLYVADTANQRIQKFDAEGNFVLTFGDQVNATTNADVCTAASGDTCQAGTFGSGDGAFGEPQSVAVDPSNGNVYVADTANNRVQKFDSSGNYLSQFGGEGSEEGKFFGPTTVAVDSTGDVYVAERFNRIQRFDSAGAFEVVFEQSFFREIAVNTANDHVYVAENSSSIREIDSTGALVETHTTGVEASGITVNPTSGQIYTTSFQNLVYILDDVTAPAAEMDPVDPVTDVTAESAVVHGFVDSNGPATTRYRFEYSTDEVDWKAAPIPDASAGSGEDPVAVSQLISPRGGLEPNTLYHVRLVATKDFGGGSDTTPAVSFTTDAVPPTVETVGWPYRTVTTASLAARINPRNTATTYYFEWGETTTYGNITPASQDGDAGSGARSILVLEELANLQPGTTYHYRVVASNGVGDPVIGEDRTVTTRVSEEPLEHGRFPGPPGSDRAYELVSMGDPNGNPAIGTGWDVISADGRRALYAISGGTDNSQNGLIFSQYFAERTGSGWQTRAIEPLRSQARGNNWIKAGATENLSQIVTWNTGFSGSLGIDPTFWRLQPGGSPQQLAEIPAEGFLATSRYSADLSVAALLNVSGSLDPDHVVPDKSGSRGYLYDFGSGMPEMIGLLPGDSVPSCGFQAGPAWKPAGETPATARQIAVDGSRIFFGTEGDAPDCESSSSTAPVHLYMREANAGGSLADGETTLISGPPVSGPDLGGSFIAATPGGPEDPAPAVFFASRSRLDPDDSEPKPEVKADPSEPSVGQTDNDIYRYDISTGTTDCLTCVVPNADVTGRDASQVAVAQDGSRLYFISPQRLIEGEGFAETVGLDNIYRYDIVGEELKYVATATSPGGSLVGTDPSQGEALTPDGRVLIFTSKHASLNALTGADNGGFEQYYRYDDSDGSLICVSCPSSGAPRANVTKVVAGGNKESLSTTPLSDDGDFYFSTVEPLLPSDQNTAPPGKSPFIGSDIYEFRDGRILLVTDGITSYSVEQEGATPKVAGSTSDGANILFRVPAKLTQDAVDSYNRVYTARVGGGFEFPQPPPPCSLEVCQGDPKGPPDEAVAGSRSFTGPSSSAQVRRGRCAKGKVRRGKRCVSKRAKRRTCRTQRGRRGKRCVSKRAKQRTCRTRNAAAKQRCTPREAKRPMGQGR